MDVTSPVGRRFGTVPLQAIAWPVARHWATRHHSPAQTYGVATPTQPAPKRHRAIRRRTDGDVAACARLLYLVHADDGYPVHWPEKPRQWLNNEDVLDAWVFVRMREILGHCSVMKADSDPLGALRWREITGHDPAELAIVSRLFVRPRVQGNGVGTALLTYAIDSAWQHGLRPVVDVVSVSSEAVELCERLGCRLLATYPWGSREESLRIHYYAAPGQL